MRLERLESTDDFKSLQDRLVADYDSVIPCIVISAGTCGQASGANELIRITKREFLARKLVDKIDIRITGCHGFCEMEPSLLIEPRRTFYPKVKPKDMVRIVDATAEGDVLEDLLYVDPETGKHIEKQDHLPFFKSQVRTILSANEKIDPIRVFNYIENGGYTGLVKVLEKGRSGWVVREVKKSGLRGRGGAGFSTGEKWEFLASQTNGSGKFIVCNADEGDPGAYMDRCVLEGNPHSIIEGMIIGAYGTGATDGVIYVRNEYPLAIKHLIIALRQARELGFLGKNILGTGFDFDIKLVRGAGAFVCGEETALMKSIEGKIGEPRQRPPFPVEKGIRNKPTLINNVETWANIPIIMKDGSQKFVKIGTKDNSGTKIFSLVGKIKYTGLVEVPMGIKIENIIRDIGGGSSGRAPIKAVQTGGPSGGCIPARKFDLTIDYDTLTEAGSIMGSGGMIVMDENTCMVDVAKYFMKFLKEESCGKCFTCRKGIQRMYEILEDITEGKGTVEHLELLEELAHVVKDTTMCGLGQTAPNPVLSTIRYFKEEYEAHIKYKICPSARCKELVPSPCQSACPIKTDAASYVALIAHGKFKEALEVNRVANPLPSICGRVCHHPCEVKCRAGETGEPIAIRDLKRFVADYGRKHGYEPSFKPATKKDGKVAIIGSGPAGLMAGWKLSQLGYEVIIFESAPIPGGMLAWGIPEYRLPKDVLNYEINNIKSLGVEIRTNITVGKDITIDDLFQQGYKAIFIATGAPKNLKLGISGEEAKGVIDPIEFLKNFNLKKEAKIGEKVAVVGGGNTAIDTARTAWRLGADVTIFYRRTRREMPANEEDIKAALEEGIKIDFLTMPLQILTKQGKITGLKCIRMTLTEIDDTGRRRPVPVEGTEYEVEIDTLIPAIGQEPDLAFLNGNLRIEISKWNTLEVNPETMATIMPGVFAGGDVVLGPATVLEAMQQGKIAAESIHKYLKGEPLEREYEPLKSVMEVPAVELAEEEVLEERARSEMSSLSTTERTGNFKEIELGISEEMAIQEARRCLRCDLEGKGGES